MFQGICKLEESPVIQEINYSSDATHSIEEVPVFDVFGPLSMIFLLHEQGKINWS